MATAVSTPKLRTGFRFDVQARHRLRLALACTALLSLTLWVAVNGFPYYRLDLGERVHAPLHATFRPSGYVGLRLGMFGLFLFGCLFVYPIRKRWKWLGSLGKTKHWLDFHVLFGISAPVLITLHSSFKMSGLAGTAYWIMIVVALSGFIGRYIYAQVPRRLNAAEMTLAEMQVLSSDLAQQLEQESVFRREDLGPLLDLPSPREVEGRSALSALWLMLRMDLARPFQVSRLRRSALTPLERVYTLGGLLPSRHRKLEIVIRAVRQQSWLSEKMLFLKRIHEVFHLWHVIHRPFSYSFVMLVLAHITIAILMGYY